MAQPIINESAAEQSVSDRLEGIEDELQLLKSEVKQTLIDLREFIMKGNALSVTSAFDGPKTHPSNSQASATDPQEIPATEVPPTETVGFVVGVPDARDDRASQVKSVDKTASDYPATPPIPYPQEISAPVLPVFGADGQGGHSMDAIKMGHIIRWLGTVARLGLTPSHLKPFLQAYERSGHLSPPMASLTLRSLEHVEYAIGRSDQPYSTTEYSSCLLELHEIICNPRYAPTEDSRVDGSQGG